MKVWRYIYIQYCVDIFLLVKDILILFAECFLNLWAYGPTILIAGWLGHALFDYFYFPTEGLFPHWRSFWSHPSVSFAMPIYLCLFFGSLLPTFSITSAFPLTSPHYYSFPPFLSSRIRPFFLKPQFALSASLLLFQSLPLSFPKALPIYKEPNIASLIPATPYLNFFFLRFPISILDFPSLAFNFL